MPGGGRTALVAPRSAARIGLVLSAFFLPTMLCTPVVGVAADIYGRRPVVLTSLATFGVAGTRGLPV